MSATTSFPANLEPPPLLFGSPPYSPRSPLPHQTPSSPPPIEAMDEPEDVDMTTSTTLPAQNHDRQDDDAMEDDRDDTAPQPIEDVDHASLGIIEAGGEDEISGDAMDTTPDPSPRPEPHTESQPLQPNSPPPHTTLDTTPAPPAMDGTSGDTSSQAFPPPAVAPGNVDNDQIEIEEPQTSSDPASETMPPPPQHDQNDDSPSEDSDDDVLQWQPVMEDASVPDAEELKEIEATKEHSATDDSYWRKRTHVVLPDPEHTPGPHGTITWVIEKLNGTREEPNAELMMESDPVQIGDYTYRIKLYPDSIDESRYMSVFLTCDSMVSPKSRAGAKEGDVGWHSRDHPSHLPRRSKRVKGKKGAKEAVVAAEVEGKEELSTAIPAQEMLKDQYQHTPLPLLEPKRIPKRPSVAVQFLIMAYNPDEPRSHYHMTFSHRFCPGAPDHGTMHFGFSKSDLAIRRRNQRAPIYHKDKIGFKAHIRLINDETGCLWERSSRDNPYDSLLITGLQGISNSGFGLSGGNMISAISTWLNLMPFRDLLYRARVPAPATEARQRPKPMLLALQKILYCLRTRPEGVGNGPFALEDLVEAFEYYALDKATDKYDTIEIWEIMRSKLEFELAGTEHESALHTLFGRKRERGLWSPHYKIPVRGMGSVQKALDDVEVLKNTVDMCDHNCPELPQVLTLELERYVFDDEKRSWHKLSDKMKLDETLVIKDFVNKREIEYKLHGFIVHKENAQSGSYYSVLRPDGPAGKWYMYTDNRDENKVMCLTRKAALDAHEGSTKKPNNEQASVAYVVTYLRSDIAARAFDNSNEPEWEIPTWLAEEATQERMLDQTDYTNAFGISPIPPADMLGTGEVAKFLAQKNLACTSKETEFEFEIIRSSAFAAHEGPGLIDLYDPKWQDSEHIVKVKLTGGCNAAAARKQVAEQVGGIKDPRQCKLWIVGSLEGMQLRPSLITTGKKEVSGGSSDFDLDWMVSELVQRAPEHRLWLHVIDEKDLPPLPEAQQQVEVAVPNLPTAESPLGAADGGEPSPPGNTIIHDNDLTDTGANNDLQPEPVVQQSQVGSPPPAPSEDEIMDAPIQEPPVAIESAAGLAPNADTTMGDMPAAPTRWATDYEIPGGNTLSTPGVPTLPNVIPGDFLNRLGGPPPPGPAMSPDYIYFFLKIFEPKMQTLRAIGSHFVERNARIDRTIYKLMDWDKQAKPLDLYEEDDIASARPLAERHSFGREDLTNGCIIIIQEKLKEEARKEMTDLGLFTNPNQYLHALGEERTFPDLGQSGRTYTMDYFSSEFYAGHLKYHMPHGKGKKIYHNADVYTGHFVLGIRHGHGSMIFSNGDTYEGQWVNGMQQGEGTSVELQTGNKYVGNWKAGKKHGKGVTHWEMAQEEELTCKICWDQEADAVFVDCGHVVACLACAKQVRDCPVCRRGVSKAIKLYLVA